jgi:hypothetical protein
VTKVLVLALETNTFVTDYPERRPGTRRRGEDGGGRSGEGERGSG